MKKEEILANFDRCEVQQIFMMTRIKNAIFMKKNKDIIDIVGKEEIFGEFFYNKDIDIERFIGSIFFGNISKFYDAWKDECNEIYKIFLEDITAKKLKIKNITNDDHEKAKKNYEDLEVLYEGIKSSSTLAKNRLHALSDSNFV